VKYVRFCNSGVNIEITTHKNNNRIRLFTRGCIMKIKVLIADDHSLVRAGIKSLLKNENDIEIIGEAKDGIETHDKAIELSPDVVVMDLSMPPGEFGLVTVKRIKERKPTIKIIVLTMLDDIKIVLNTLRNGVNGYILKSADDFDLAKVIKKVHSGEYYINHDKATECLIEFFKKNAVHSHEFLSLSAREQEILSYTAKGYSNKEISEMLYLSVKTLEGYQTKIRKKIGVTSKSDLVKYAHENGLLNF